MKGITVGRVFRVGDNINTDQIIPARYLDLYEPVDLGRHAFEGMGQECPSQVGSCRFVVAGENFGLGSAREQAPNALKGAGIEAVIARSFARIYFRNSINVGLLPIVCPDAAEVIEMTDEISVDPESSLISVPGKGEYRFSPLTGPVEEILEAGGMVPFLLRQIEACR